MGRKGSQEIRVDPDPEALQGLKDQKEILELQVSLAHLGSKAQEASKENLVILGNMGRKVTEVYKVILDLLDNLDFKDLLECLEDLGSQVFLAKQEIWDQKDSKEQGEGEVKRVTEVKWDCQEEKETREKREKLEQKDLLDFLVLKENLDQ